MEKQQKGVHLVKVEGAPYHFAGNILVKKDFALLLVDLDDLRGPVCNLLLVDRSAESTLSVICARFFVEHLLDEGVSGAPASQYDLDVHSFKVVCSLSGCHAGERVEERQVTAHPFSGQDHHA